VNFLRFCAVFALFGLAAPEVAGAQSGGTYQMDGGSYTMTVEVGTNELIVVEPNKRSVYRRVGTTQEYRFFNASTGSTFALRVLDDRTLRASRVPETVAPNILRLVGEASAATAVAQTDRFKAMADRYRLLAEGDTDNTQMWTFCAAAALGWAMKPEAEAAAYAWRAAQQVKSIAVDPARSPCPDAIPAALWESTTAPAEGSALARAPQPSARTARGASGDVRAAPTTGAAPAATPRESAATAALRARAESATGASANARAAVEAQDSVLMRGLTSLAPVDVENGVAGAVASVVTGGVARSGAVVSAAALLLPTPDQWMTVWKDFRARRAAIDAQNAYVAQLRRDRLASGAPDVQGFKVPVRPLPTDIVDQSQKARVTGYGIVPQFDPSQRAYWMQSLRTIGATTGDSSFYAYDWRNSPKPEDWLPGFSARLVSNAIDLQFTVESTEGKLRPYQQLWCNVYGPDGERIGQANAMGLGSRRRLEWKQDFDVIIILRTWRPGTYGIECGGPFSDAPWMNLTFDVVP
jgi:hypothetical protein